MRRLSTVARATMLCAFVMAGCRDGGGPNAATGAPAAAAPPAAGMPYQLVCDSADTSASSTLFCMRLDTRTGDVRAIDLSLLPVSGGPTASAEGPAGTYDLVCDSTATATKADFRCIRLNRQTGELLVIALPKVGVFPEK